MGYAHPHRVSLSAVIQAEPDRVYGIIADYRNGHPRILPPEFSALTVEKGGVGAGTVINFKMRLFGRTQDFRSSRVTWDRRNQCTGHVGVAADLPRVLRSVDIRRELELLAAVAERPAEAHRRSSSAAALRLTGHLAQRVRIGPSTASSRT